MNLHPLFSPRSIAVVGASTKPASVGYTLTENLLKNGYTGRVYPVNPKTDRLFDRTCYPRLEDVPEKVDLAIIIIPAALVPNVLRNAGELGIKACIIISSGFRETGEAGQALEKEISDIARRYEMLLLGPNCLGFLHPALGLNASFAKVLPQKGGIAFFSQSGALATALLDLTRDTLGFSYFVSTGNKAVLSEKEFLEFFAREKDVTHMAFYTESISDAGGFIELGRQLLAEFPDKLRLALKSGLTREGRLASSSHTGALAGSAQAYRALFRQARMLQAETLEELHNYLLVLSQNPLPRGKRLAILTNAGGLGVLAADAASLSGLTLAPLAPITLERLAAFLPSSASAKNPIDILGDADALRYARSLQALITDPNVDMLLVIVTPQTTTEVQKTAQAIAEVKETSSLPVVAVFAGAASLSSGLRVLQEKGVASLVYPEAGVRSLAALYQAAEWRRGKTRTPFARGKIAHAQAARAFQEARAERRDYLSEGQTAAVLHAYGFPLLKSVVVRNVGEVEALAKKWTARTSALKIISADILHKSDAGGVALNIPAEKMAEEYEALLARVQKSVPEARLEGVLVMEMAPAGGTEIFLGMKKENDLGSLLAVGLGGIYVETWNDLSYRFAPVCREDVEEMLRELRCAPLLEGARGQEGIERGVLVDYVGRLSFLASDFPEICEIDINPLLAFSEGKNFCVLDARIRIEKSEK